MAYRIPSLRAPSAVLAGALLLGACSDTAEPEPTDFVGEWEYVVTDHPLPDAPSTSIPPRTFGVLSPCGPTWWRLDMPHHNPKENLA
jgi:hypothetical protein